MGMLGGFKVENLKDTSWTFYKLGTGRTRGSKGERQGRATI